MAYAYSQNLTYTGDAAATDGLLAVLIGAPGSPGHFHIRADGAQNWPVDIAVSFDGGTTLENFVRLRAKYGVHDWVVIFIPHDLSADGTLTVLWGDAGAPDYHDSNLVDFLDECGTSTVFQPGGDIKYVSFENDVIFGLTSDDDPDPGVYIYASGLTLPSTGTLVTAIHISDTPSAYWQWFGIFADDTFADGIWVKQRGNSYLYTGIKTAGSWSEASAYDCCLSDNVMVIYGLAYYTDKVVGFSSGDSLGVAKQRVEYAGTPPSSFTAMQIGLDHAYLPGVAVFNTPKEIIFPNENFKVFTPKQPPAVYKSTYIQSTSKKILRISGTTLIDGSPASCIVEVIDRATGYHIHTVSDPNGNFVIDIPYPLINKWFGISGQETERFLVVCRDPSGGKNAQVFDLVTASSITP